MKRESAPAIESTVSSQPDSQGAAVPKVIAGRYDIERELGHGGMGRVFLAHDRKLRRKVAIKMLSGAHTPETLQRFELEARAAGSLNHPNIVAVFDVGAGDDGPYIVSELLEGQTLRSLLEGRALRLQRALGLALQLAQGLAAAHEKGVIHRDLKPDNLFVTSDGRLKIFDFGIAKLIGDRGEGNRVTESGAIMGTVGYMSPEQVRGEHADHRSDIFSVGVILHELFGGETPFAGHTPIEMGSAILNDDPRPLPPGVPEQLEAVVLRCLEKNPARRFQSAADLAFDLAQLVESKSTRPRRGRGPGWAWLAAGVAACAASAFTAWVARGPGAGELLVAVRLLTYSDHDSSPAVSPDGQTLAFTSDRGARPTIWLKQFHGGDERALTSGPDDFPRFSPDGSSILFIRTAGTRTDLYRTTLLGSEPRKMAEDVAQADWSPDGKKIACVRVRAAEDSVESILFTVPGSGGPEQVIARFPRVFLAFPRWSPDGRRITMNTPRAIWGGTIRSIRVADVVDGSVLAIEPPNNLGSLTSAAWINPEEFLFLQAESVGDTVSVSGARLYRQHIRSRVAKPIIWVANMGSTLDLHRDGRVIFDGRSGRQNLREYDLTNRSAPRWITRGSVSDRQPVFAPDGEWVAFSSNRSGNLDLWAVSRQTGAIRALIDDPADDWDPGFTPDGGSLVWSSHLSGNLEIWIANRDGTGVRQLTHDGVDAQNPTVTRDGQWVVYSTANPAHRGLWKIHPDGSGAQQIVASSTARLPDVSPDGAYVLFSAEDGPNVFIHAARVDTGDKVPFEVRLQARKKTVLNVGRVRWAPDGKRILFTGQDEQGLDGIYIQDFVPGKDTTASRRPLAGFTPDSVTESMGISPDGTRLVVSESEWANSIYVAESLSGQPVR